MLESDSEKYISGSVTDIKISDGEVESVSIKTADGIEHSFSAEQIVKHMFLDKAEDE